MNPIRCPTEGYPFMAYKCRTGNEITAFAVFSLDQMQFAAAYNPAVEEKSKEIRERGLPLTKAGDLQDIVSRVLQSANIGATGMFHGQEAKIVADNERKVVIQTNNSEYFLDIHKVVRQIAK
jgi:hypothetical protein